MKERMLHPYVLASLPLCGAVLMAYMAHESQFGPFGDNGMPEILYGVSAFSGLCSVVSFIVASKIK